MKICVSHPFRYRASFAITSLKNSLSFKFPKEEDDSSTSHSEKKIVF